MREVHSGTTTERILRSAVFAALMIVFAAWYLWDGYVGYSRSNVTAVVRALGLDLEQAFPFDPNLTAAEAGQFLEEVGKGAPVGEMTSRLGDPALEHKGDAYYFGPAGYLMVHVERGRVQEAEWRTAPHSESDLRWQRRIGYVMALVALVAIVHLIRVVTTKVSLTDAGLQVRGKPLIPFKAMTVLRKGEYRETVAVEYSLAGRTGVVRLDSYVVKELPAIVSGICERAGFPHPTASAQEGPGVSDS
jgi:hypothetical protein